MHHLKQTGFLTKLKRLPGVYKMVDEEENILYVGKARDLKKRLLSYFRANLAPKTAALMSHTCNIHTVVTNSESEALVLENNLIKKHRPRYNILLRDDKSYPYIRLDNAKFPRLGFYRGSRKEKGRYFGPYPGSNAVRQSLKILQKIFRLRQCEETFFKNRSRPCLEYQIKRCSAPCAGLISKEDYAQDVASTIMFLEGKSEQVAKIIEKRMLEASQKLEFEQAAVFRDQINSLRRVQENQVLSAKNHDMDIVAIAVSEKNAVAHVMTFRGGNNYGGRNFYLKNINREHYEEIVRAFLSQHYISRFTPSEIIIGPDFAGSKILARVFSEYCGRKIKIVSVPRGEKKRLLTLANTNANIALEERLALHDYAAGRMESLMEDLNLEALPQHMECFDVSHISGEATVASCVVFVNGRPAKDNYRKFNIKFARCADDYAAIGEAVERRYSRLIREKAKLPDLILIDGGKGQLAKACEVARKLDLDTIKLIGIAKGKDRKSGEETLIHGENFTQFKLDNHNPGFHLIRHIRDEAHRFALTAHRKKRAKARAVSRLEDIAGIGPKRRKALLIFFGGLDKVKNAAPKELERVPGISRIHARRIYDFFH